MTIPDPVSLLKNEKIVPVVAIDHVRQAPALGRALLAGGLRAIEITLRTTAGLDAIRCLREEVPELIVGAGTLRTPKQVEDSIKAGACFGVAPAAHPLTMRAAQQAGLSFFPGVATPLDIENALEAGFTALKFFPAQPLGGLSYLKAIAAPYLHWGVRFMPTGGITPEILNSYLAFERVFAVGGTWIASHEAVMADDWNTVAKRAAEAATLISNLCPHS